MRIVTVAVAADTIKPYPATNKTYQVCVFINPITGDTVTLPVLIITRDEWEMQGGE